ncbi:MAG: RuBisCO large subunit C-terminal-like domain-containing protein [Eubacteriales bacterium]|nr:RuBisCO large subunit C-terminal-like domain-containing protein [Eubacteriales bacterium]
MYFDFPFDNEENIASGDFVIATYLVSGVSEQDALARAGKFAIGQTVGTWAELPGITRSMVEGYQARVLSLELIPAEPVCAMLRVAFPAHNLPSFAMLQTALVGNDVSTALCVKLLDIALTQTALKRFRGPAQSVSGVRALAGVMDRPLVLNMIKPCIGYSAEEGATLFYESAMGGIDLIKDDEVLAEIPILSVAQRVHAYQKESQRVCESRGTAPVYIPNITGRPKYMRQTAQMLVGEGAQMAMVNFVTTGLDAFAELTEEFGDRLAFLAHYAGAGMMSSDWLGYANPVFLGTLARLAGADMVMTMYPGAPGSKGYLEFLKTVQKQKLPLGQMKPVFTVVGGGVTPLNLSAVIHELGSDVVLGVGGAIQGHPMGARSGAEATMAAVNAAYAGISLEEAAKDCPPLAAALGGFH